MKLCKVQFDDDEKTYGPIDTETSEKEDGSKSVFDIVNKLPYIGLFMALLSSLLFSLSSVVMKKMEAFSFGEFAMTQNIALLVLTIPPLAYCKAPVLPKNNKLYLFLRSIFGVASYFFLFHAFMHLPLGDATVILSSTPVFVTIFGRIFLQEPCDLPRAFVILLTTVGLVLVAQPPFLFGDASNGETLQWKGVASALACNIIGSSIYILLRVLQDIHVLTILLSTSIVGFAITVPIVYFVGFSSAFLRWENIWKISGMSVLIFSTQLLKTKALQLEEAGPVAILSSSNVAFSFLLQYLLFGEDLSIMSLIGAGIILVAIIVLLVYKWKIESKSNEIPNEIADEMPNKMLDEIRSETHKQGAGQYAEFL